MLRIHLHPTYSSTCYCVLPRDVPRWPCMDSSPAAVAMLHNSQFVPVVSSINFHSFPCDSHGKYCKILLFIKLSEHYSSLVYVCNAISHPDIPRCHIGLPQFGMDVRWNHYQLQQCYQALSSFQLCVDFISILLSVVLFCIFDQCQRPNGVVVPSVG